MKNKNLSWVGALFVFALLLWCTAVTPGKVADPATYTCAVYSTFFSLLPPVIAIVLALNTKEVYTSLLVGIASGALLYANGNLELALNTLFFNEDGGMITKLSDSGNVGILAFLVMLGILVALMNKAGGSAAFGRWASKHIHSRAGAQFATLLLGVMIFVDDYFNCLTVGSVMRPVTDRQKVSRAKLAYLIDATAAPVCMIAPVSSWAAAVSGVAADLGTGVSGIELFVRAIPYNFYSLLTFVFIIGLAVMQFDYGPMKLHEMNAMLNGELGAQETEDAQEGNPRGRVLDLVLPVAVLIVSCVIGMIYVGGYFGVDAWGGTDYAGDFIGAFGNTDAFISLPWGALIALVLTIIYMIARRLMTFKEAMACVPKGFIAMVPPIIILTLAVSLKAMINALGADVYVYDLMYAASAWLYSMLPAVIFVVACILAFASGTSWGTFGILIPIVTLSLIHI